MKIPKGGVAIFDSGIGGMTVLDACRKQLPNTLFYYYGDNRHAPYGNLSTKAIYRYTNRAFKRFRRLKVRAAVIACNTATAVCIDKLRKKYKFPIIGAEPAVHSAAKKGGEIFVLSTRATHDSARFQRLCKRVAEKYPQAIIKAYACDDLAGEIERRLPDTHYDFTVHFPPGAPKTVVLGCTHYIYIKEAVERFYHCEVMDGNYGIAAQLTSMLKKAKYQDMRKKRKIFRDYRPRLTTFMNIAQSANICLLKKWCNSRQNRQKNNIFFLGCTKNANKIRYEQMFAYNIDLKMRENGG